MANNACCPGSGYLSGCLVCGGELIYSPDKPFQVSCYYCGKTESAQVFCANGHYVCDECHRRDILALVEQICWQSRATDPLELALEIFALPMLHMHGPEYHSIVPAVLVAAYGNSLGRQNRLAIKVAIARGKAVPGGACGSHGACGAAVGLGIAYAVIHQTTPLSLAERGRANELTALALLEIGKRGGARCCKREAVTAIQVAKAALGVFGDSGRPYLCRQFSGNPDCLHRQCPFFPSQGADPAGV